jgi:hypothetical protein
MCFERTQGNTAHWRHPFVPDLLTPRRVWRFREFDSLFRNTSTCGQRRDRTAELCRSVQRRIIPQSSSTGSRQVRVLRVSPGNFGAKLSRTDLAVSNSPTEAPGSCVRECPSGFGREGIRVGPVFLEDQVFMAI